MGLSEVQVEVARLFFEQPGSDAFALAGGSALLASGFDHRLTRDLDFFTPEPHDVIAVLPPFCAALRSAGFTVEVVRQAPHAARLVISRADLDLEIDVARDFRLRPAVSSPVGPVLATSELAADKTLALFGRAEPRDFHDVYVLSERFGREELLQLARQKDAGFDPYHFASALARIDVLRRSEFQVDDEAYGRMLDFFRAWRNEILAAHGFE